jgi:hypothetical protein
MKYEKIDWQVSATMERIVAEMTFDTFDQSMRFMDVLINFLREEKALVAQDFQRPARDERPSAAGIAGQSERTQDEAPRDAEAPQEAILGKEAAGTISPQDERSGNAEVPSSS